MENKYWIAFIISFGIPLLMVFGLWLNSFLLERERKLILAGKKKPWGDRK